MPMYEVRTVDNKTVLLNGVPQRYIGMFYAKVAMETLDKTQRYNAPHYIEEVEEHAPINL